MRNTGMISARLSNSAASKTSKFAEKLHDYILFKDIDNKYLTLKDCIEQNKKADTEEKAEDTEKTEDTEEEGRK